MSMEDEEIQRLVSIFEECGLTYEQNSREGYISSIIERVAMQMDRYIDHPKELSTSNGLVFFLGYMLEEVIPNTEEWKQRATKMGMETTHVDAQLVLQPTKEDAPPILILKEDDHEPLLNPTCPNIDSWLESSMREKHEAIFGELEILLHGLYDLDSSITTFMDRSTCELEKEEHLAAVDFVDDSIALCEGVEICKSFILNELPHEISKPMLQIDKVAGIDIDLFSTHENLELISQSIVMEVPMNWKKKKKVAKRIHFCNVSSSWVRYSHSLTIISMVEKRIVEKRWWKKKKWKDKRRGQIMCQTTLVG